MILHRENEFKGHLKNIVGKAEAAACSPLSELDAPEAAIPKPTRI